MATRLWANNHWEVATDGMCSLGPENYFIHRDRLCIRREGMESRGIADFPLNLADKSWVAIDPFLEAFEKALDLLRPKGADHIDLVATADLARQRASVTRPRRR